MCDPTQSHVRAMQVAIEVVRLKVAERRRQACRTIRSRAQAVLRPIEHVRDAIRVAERVIDLQAVLVRRLDRASVLGHVVVVHVAECSRSGALVGHKRRARQCDIVLRRLAEPLDRNPVVRKRIANQHAVHQPLRRRIVNRDALAARVHPVREIAVPHFRCGHTAKRRITALFVVKPFVRRKEESAIPSAVQTRNRQWSPEGPTDVALLVNPLRRLEESFLVEAS